ncbi:uncharacterized protein M421DRAFT_424065 [Didymella exigua CBS 183.55]|uniref:4'-phosphopantetheinyl transferase domain-containing protein n=1 Tax=Didymella exigua CBS 183.55 TaxID=1150837 RepID=A0A6A5RC49_9PLEO|nr:uncharacterized protein M421DRAFT_424065 [Didymella exigua CBS 183.55]KAF1925262.1 hypothetical protein M421DRAFT_424065 [Didymella exigua CBS 183.55]
MPLRPFPHPFRIGTDLCHVKRIAQIIKAKENGNAGRPLEQFLSKILTHPERAYFRRRFGSNQAVSRNLQNVSHFLAGRFAAKEACRKACDHLDKNTRGFQHIVILPVNGAGQQEHQSQRPEGLILHEALREAEDAEAAEEAPFDVTTLDGQMCEISISHDGDYAHAVALVPSMKHSGSSAGVASATRVSAQGQVASFPNISIRLS